MVNRATGLLCCVVAVLVSSGCGRSSDERRPLNVYAASSLTEAFRELETRFEATHPGSDVTLSFAGSQVLRLQIEQGADADVFASANSDHMAALLAAGKVRAPQVFARGELVVIVPHDNPAGLSSYADMPRARRIVVGTEQVPAGRYTREALERLATERGDDFDAAVRRRVVSTESNVRLVRAKVELGEADAALVYRSDALASERVKVLPIPKSAQPDITYPIALLEDADNDEQGQAWLRFVQSQTGRDVLRKHGFLVSE